MQAITQLTTEWSLKKSNPKDNDSSGQHAELTERPGLQDQESRLHLEHARSW